MSETIGKIKKQIMHGTEEAEKTYGFKEDHNPNLPAQFWFQESNEGNILFIVFYTQACRWSKCLGCNLPSLMSSTHISYKNLMAQIDHIFSLPEVIEKGKGLDKLIISNNGSILDEETFSSTALMYLIAKVNLILPNISMISFESRPEYVDIEELEFISRALKESDKPTQLEISIGFEAFDEHIRNDIFDKGLSLEKVDRLAKLLAPYKFHLKCYFMQKPVPGISDEAALQDIKDGIDYLDSLSKKYSTVINMHLNPTYAATGTKLEEEFLKGNYAPPKLIDVAKAVYYSKDKDISIFLGLSDEGLACPGGSYIKPENMEMIALLEKFNKTQNYDILEKMLNK